MDLLLLRHRLRRRRGGNERKRRDKETKEQQNSDHHARARRGRQGTGVRWVFRGVRCADRIVIDDDDIAKHSTPSASKIEP